MLALGPPPSISTRLNEVKQSRNTSLFASNALGAYTAVVGINTEAGYEISALMYPLHPTIDTDKDGRYDAVVLRDTAYLGDDYINSYIVDVYYEPPLINIDPKSVEMLPVNPSRWQKIFYNAMKYMFYTGVPQAVLMFPGWLKAPWLDYTISRSNFSALMERAWSDVRGYTLFSATLPIIRNKVNMVFNGSLYTVPPSMALALGKVIDYLPVVYEAETPSLLPFYMDTIEVRDGHGAKNIGGVNITIGVDVERVIGETVLVHVEAYADGIPVFNDTVKIKYTFSGQEGGWIYFKHRDTYYLVKIKLASTEDSESTGGGGDNNTGNEISTQPSQSINTTIQLLPFYVNESTPWGEMPVLDRLRGTSIVNATNITVIAIYGGDGYDIYIYINSSYAYGTYTNLPATIEFTYNNTEYRIEVKPPVPPVINQTIELELVPVDQIPVQLPNGSWVNITIYMVNQNITINNATVVVFGYISRLGTDLDIYVFGVPPAQYNVSIEGFNATTSIDYSGTLHIYIHYQSPEDQLIPQGTATKIVIQPLDLIMTILLNG